MDRSLLWKILAVVGGVIVLAGVIFGVAAISAPSGGPGGLPFIPFGSKPTSTGPTVVPNFTSDSSPTATGSSPSTAAATATAGGTSVTPPTVVTRTVSNDYRVTRPTSGSGSTTTSGSAGSGTGKTVPKPKTLKDMLPSSIAGYSVSGRESHTDVVMLNIQPTDAKSHLQLAVLTAHDFGSAAKATAFIENSLKRIYRSNQQSVVVPGGVVFYGTQGTLFGDAAFYSGRYAYEVTVTSANGDPLSLKDTAAKLAQTFNLP